MPDPDKLEVEESADAVIVRFLDKKILNDPAMEILGGRLYAIADKLRTRTLILDFANVQYLQSSVLGVMVTLNRKALAGGGKLLFRNIDPEVRRVLAMTRLDQLFTVEAPGTQSNG